MTISERLQNVVENYSNTFSNADIRKEHDSIDDHRGFQGHSISDQQKRPYWDGIRLKPQVSFYNC